MWELMGRMRRSIKRKFASVSPPIELPDIDRLHTFREYDDALTAPLHGFKSAEDYYLRCSSRQFLKNIKVPTLVVHSADDPFMTEAAIPRDDELSESVCFELSRRGGHVGFMYGNVFKPRRWLDERIGRHLSEHLKSQK